MGILVWIANLLASAASNLATSDQLWAAVTVSLPAALIAGIVWHRERFARGKRGMDSWWVIGLCAVVAFITVAVACFGLGLRAAQRPLAGSLVPPRSNKQQSRIYLKDAHIYAGLESPLVKPRFEAKFARSGQRCRLFVEERYYPRAIMSSNWVPRPLVELAEIRDFVPGQTINVPLLTPFEVENRRLWRWGPPSEQPDPATTFLASSWHRGRVIVRCDDAAPQNFYFVIDAGTDSDVPAIVGQQQFDFVQEWEAQDEQQK